MQELLVSLVPCSMRAAPRARARAVVVPPLVRRHRMTVAGQLDGSGHSSYAAEMIWVCDHGRERGGVLIMDRVVHFVINDALRVAGVDAAGPHPMSVHKHHPSLTKSRGD